MSSGPRQSEPPEATPGRDGEAAAPAAGDAAPPAGPRSASTAPPTEPTQDDAVDSQPGGPGVWWRLPGSVRLAIVIVAAGVLVGFALTLREPTVGFSAPERGDGQHVYNPAGVLDAGAVDGRLADLEEATGIDAVVVAWEDRQSSLGQAARGAERITEAWDADVALSAVAHPRAFTDADAGERFFGVEGDRFEVTSDLRERVVAEVEDRAPVDRDGWTAAVLDAIDELEAALPPGG